MNKLIFAVFTSIIIALVTLYTGRMNKIESDKSILQRIMDSNITANKLQVHHIELPLITSQLYTSQYNGYFTIRGKDNTEITESCAVMTVDYLARSTGGSNHTISIEGLNMMRLRRCN